MILQHRIKIPFVVSKSSSYVPRQIHYISQVTQEDLNLIESRFGPSIVVCIVDNSFFVSLTPSHESLFYSASDNIALIYFHEKTFLDSVFNGYSSSTVCISQEILVSQGYVDNLKSGIIYPSSTLSFSSDFSYPVFKWLLTPENFGIASNHSECVDELIDKFSSLPSLSQIIHHL